MVQRIFGVPFVPARLFPLVAAVAALLIAVPAGTTVTDWVLALASAFLTIGGGTWVWPVTVAQSVLLVAAAGTPAGYVVQALAMFAVVELIMRGEGPWPVVGVAGATVVHIWRLTEGDLARTVFWTVLLIVVPVGFGLALGSVRMWMARYYEQLRESERLRESEAMAARATERAAIARELHDLIAHHVASIVLRIGVARHVVPDTGGRMAEVLDDVHATGTTALADLRELVTVLRDPATDAVLSPLNPADLPAALAEVADRVSAAGLPVAVDLDPAVVDLDAVRRLAVLRIAQEGLTNALKHADRATGASLRVRLAEDGRVEIDVRDDGVAGAAPAGGHGLVGLRERVDLLDGSFHAGAGTDGWSLRAVLPAPEGQGT